MLSQSPADYTVMAPDTSFTTNWTVKNTGTAAWTTDSYDVKYLGTSGLPFHQGADGYDLPTNVEPGWTYSVAVPMIAPSALGPYSKGSGIFSGGSVNICTFWITINVNSNRVITKKSPPTTNNSISVETVVAVVR